MKNITSIFAVVLTTLALSSCSAPFLSFDNGIVSLDHEKLRETVNQTYSNAIHPFTSASNGVQSALCQSVLSGALLDKYSAIAGVKVSKYNNLDIRYNGSGCSVYLNLGNGQEKEILSGSVR